MEILIGCYGWKNPKLEDGFYPEDMPTEWQLDFYANYFRTVLVPQKDWFLWKEDDFTDLLESVSFDDKAEGAIKFKFYLEFFNNDSCDTSKAVNQLKLIKQNLGDYCAGVFISTLKYSFDFIPIGLYNEADSALGMCFNAEYISFAMVPENYSHPKQLADWAKKAKTKLNKSTFKSSKEQFLPIFLGAPTKHLSGRIANQAKTLKTIFELLGA